MTSDAETTALLREGETVWRVAHADRLAFLVDGEAFFRVLGDSLANARASVWLLGWDFHSAVRLYRDTDSDRPDELRALLDTLARERSSLHVRILAWDFAMLYALEREFLPLLHFGAGTHRRVHFAMDSAHPVAASQHQKLVVIDDSLAFVGGFDLTAHRWDTRAHRPGDSRRVTPSGKTYPPFHDVQIAVDGEAASVLAALARERWRRATHRKVRATEARGDPWPPNLEPHIRDVTVGIARTRPSYQGAREIREVEALYRESIAAARRCIYIENQYLTSPRVTAWLAERLRASDGPEIVIVGPRENSGWLEESTMGALRDRAVRELRGADRSDRLRVVYPHVAGLPEGEVLNVHSKVMTVDDTFARVGSSNLSNRSLGLDTECDVALVARGDEPVRRAIAGFRNDLLAEHLGTTAARVASELERTGSLVQVVDALSGDTERTLRPLELEASRWTAEALDTLGAIDPEHPVPFEELVARFEEERDASPRGRRRWRFVVLLLVVGGVGLAWRATPLGEWVTGERVADALAFLREPWYGPLLATVIFTLGCLLLLPITALTVGTGLALGPAVGIAVAWLGAIAAAAIGHLAGRLLWRDWVRRLAGRRVNALSRRLARRGILSSALLRIVPMAPFMIVNLVAGASHVRGRDFVAGTALGTFPGTVALILAADWMKALFSEPSGPAWLWAALAVAGFVGAVAALRRFVGRRPFGGAARS